MTIGIEIIPFRVTDAEELGAALAAIEMARSDGLLISNDALLLSARSRLVAFARDRALPAVYGQREYVETAKARPGTVSYATVGAGSIGHLAMELLWKQAGVRLVHVRYRGGGPAFTPVTSI